MKFIQFKDTDENDHFVNVDHIVQLHTKKLTEWGPTGSKIRDYTGYFVNVANAGVACYNAEDIKVDEHTYFHLVEWLG